MFKLRLRVLLALLGMLSLFSCTSAPKQNTTEAQKKESAQKARNTADRAFTQEMGEGIGDEDIPLSLASEPKSNIAKNKNDEEIISFDEPAVMIAMSETLKGEQPLWVKSPQKVFPLSQYLSAVGMGKNTAEAENAAIASIGKIIKQHVSSRIITTEKDAVSSSGLSSTSSSLDEIIETYSVVDALVGVKIHEFWWSDDGYIYALAYLHKTEAAQYYTKKIAENEIFIVEKLSSVQSLKGSFESFAAVQKAVRAAEENNQYLDILNAVQPSAYKTIALSYGSEQKVKEAAYEAAKNISIDVKVKGTEDERIASALSLMLSSYGFKTKIVDEPSAPYVIEADVEFMDVPSERNKYVRYIFNAYLKEVATGKVLLPYSENKREGHTSSSEAQQRALRSLEKSIAENYAQAFVDYLKI